MKKKVTKRSSLDTFYLTLGYLILIYTGLSTVSFIGGMSGGGEYRAWRGCYESPTRLRLIFSAYEIGCFITAPADQPYFNYKTREKLLALRAAEEEARENNEKREREAKQLKSQQTQLQKVLQELKTLKACREILYKSEIY